MQTTLVVREPNASLPEDFKTKLLEGCTFLGYASAQDSHIHTEPFIGSEVDLADAVKSIEDTYGKERVYYCAMTAKDDEINLESLQPFSLIEDEEKRCLLAVMAEGEFPQYAEKSEDGELFTPEYRVVDEAVRPIITELWELAGGEIDQLMLFLKNKKQQDKLNALLGERANILFIPYKGQSWAVSKNKDAARWEWGFSTRSLGYAEETKKEEETKSEEPKKKLTIQEQLALKKKKMQESGTAEKKELPAGGSPIDPAEAFKDLIAKDSRFFLNQNVLWARPPKGASWKEAKTWWNTHMSTARPQEPKNVYAGGPADELRPNSPLFELKNKTKVAESVQGPAEPKEEEKKDEKPKIDGMTLLITNEKKARFLELKKDGKIRSVDEDYLKATLDAYSPASLQLGENFNEVLWWKPESLAIQDHHTLVCLWHELRCRLLGLMDKDEEEQKPEEKPEKKTEESKKKLSIQEQLALKKSKAA